MKYTLLLCNLLMVGMLNSQKYDYNWFAGDDAPNSPETTNFVLDFNHYPVKVTTVETSYFLSLTHHSMSDIDGKFLFYSNGCSMWQYNDPPVLVSDQLNNEDYLCGNPSQEAMNIMHGLFSLPIDNDRFTVFSLTVIPQTNCYQKKFIYHIVDFSTGDGVIEVQDSILATGCFKGAVANRHANGRDWWILLSDRNEHRFFRWLLTPNGLSQPDTQLISQVPTPGYVYPWYEFSPDGTKLATRFQDGGTVIYDFDRCSGLLSNCQVIPKAYNLDHVVTFSANSQYLYTTEENRFKLLQYDLNATDVASSEKIVATYDGFVDSSNFNYTTFDAMTRGVDGKIYIFGGASHYMHVIDFPDRPGTACNVRQRAISFPSPTFSANAYYPNYRLGPIDGSSCDTLGINNIPMAMYHYDFEDTLSPMAVTFTDVSYYEPATWYWTFGDGSSSSEVSPVHTYSLPGTYTACLVVSNQYGSDTLCREIQIDTVSGVTNLPVIPHVIVTPNPFQDILQVKLPAIINGTEPKFRLTDLFGRVVMERALKDFENTITVGSLPSGIYVWQVDWKGKVTQSGKVVKM